MLVCPTSSTGKFTVLNLQVVVALNLQLQPQVALAAHSQHPCQGIGVGVCLLLVGEEILVRELVPTTGVDRRMGWSHYQHLYKDQLY